MSKLQRVGNIIIGILTILCGLVLLSIPSYGLPIIILILGITFSASGIRTLIHYFQMARFMVGGKSVLYRGVILMDLGFLTFSLVGVSKGYVALYLAATYVFSGAIGILRGMEKRKVHAPHWLFQVLQGAVLALLGLICLVFLRSNEILVVVYSVGLFVSAIARITTAFRRTAVVFIQ